MKPIPTKFHSTGLSVVVFKDSGTGFNAEGQYIGSGDRGEITNTDEFFKSMAQQFVDIAAGEMDGKSALAPAWLSQTAHAQATRGYDEPIYEDRWVDLYSGGYYEQVQVGTRHVGGVNDPFAGLKTEVGKVWSVMLDEGILYGSGRVLSTLGMQATLLGLIKLLTAIALAFASINPTLAQSSASSLELSKRIDMYGTDSRPPVLGGPESVWSPESMVWSPDGKRIAFSAYSQRPFGVVDIETGKITSIASEFRGNGTVHWSKVLNRLVLVQPTEASVYDMNAATPKPLYVIQNMFPKVLSAVGSSVVNVADEDYLVLIGNTNWRVEKTNPHIAAYNLRTGERKWTYQLLNPPFDEKLARWGDTGFQTIRATAASNAQGEVLVAMYASRSIGVEVGPTGRESFRREHALWLINLTQGKEQCYINLFDKPSIQKNEYAGPLGALKGLSIDPLGRWVLITHSQFSHVYDTSSCTLSQALEPELHEGTDHGPKGNRTLSSQKAPISMTTVSPDGRWLLGYGYWAPNRYKAALRLWQVGSWRQVLDGTRVDDGGIAAAAMNSDGKYLAFGESRRITIYKINE